MTKLFVVQTEFILQMKITQIDWTMNQLEKIKQENQYTQKLIYDFFINLFQQKDEEFIKKILKENKFEIEKSFQILKNEKGNEKKIVEEDDELFPNLCEEGEEKEISPLEEVKETNFKFPSKQLEGSPVDLIEFLKLEDGFIVFTSQISEYIFESKFLLSQILKLHETAIIQDINTIDLFLDKLISFVHLDVQILRESIIYCFDEMLELCFSFSDLLRLKATEFMLDLIDPKNLKINGERAKDLSVMYHSLTNEKNWYSTLKEYTFELNREKMTKNETKVLYRLNKIKLYSLGKLSKEEEETLNCFKDKISKNLKLFGGSGFVKLSSRSPKDSGFISTKYTEMVETMKQQWIKTYQLEFDVNNEIPKSIQNSIEQICCAKCLMVNKAEDAVELFINSQRTLVDLMISLEKNDSSSIDLELIIKKWYDIPICYEMRGFVRNKRLNALSQYFSKEFFPWISLEDWKKIKAKVLEFYEKKVAPIIDILDFTIDFILFEDEIRIIELNSFGEIAGAALFSWIEDEDILYNGPFEFRVIQDEHLNIAKI
jgi:hypothetical protein